MKSPLNTKSIEGIKMKKEFTVVIERMKMEFMSHLYRTGRLPYAS
jgi:hypothetical protein